MGIGDSDETLLLGKIIPGPLHLYLSVNEVINFCENQSWLEMNTLLADITGIQVHVYIGWVKMGIMRAPVLKKICRNLEDIKDYMETDTKLPYYHTFLAFGQLSQSVFSTELHPQWREHIYTLRAILCTLNCTQGMPLTPKLHIIVVHVE